MSTALARNNEELFERRAKAVEVASKNAKDLTKEDRPYYGVPRWRNIDTIDSNGRIVRNSNFTHIVKDKKRFESYESCLHTEYVDLLQDQFYRMFMGYELHYFQEPKDKAHIDVYNRTAIECGHPEYCIGAAKPAAPVAKAAPVESSSIKKDSTIMPKQNKPKLNGPIINTAGTTKVDNSKRQTVLNNPKKEEMEQPKREVPKAYEIVVADTVDVLDNNDNVIAEGISIKSKKEEKAQPKMDKEQPKQEKKEEPTPEKKNDTKDKKESNAESSVIFCEIDPNGRKLTVDKNRYNEFKEVNAPVIKQYPGIDRLVEACKKQNKLVCLRFKDPDTKESFNGLIHATIFDKGVPGKAHEVLIDPAKVRDHYSFIRPAEAPNQVFPFECPMVSFDKYLDEYIATNGQLSPESARAVDDECMPNYKFLYHVMYSSIPEADLSYVAMVLTPLFFEIDRSNLSIRFKAIDYTSKYSFTLYCAENVGLGKYAKDNTRFSGLKIEVRVASEKDIKFRAIGKHAQEFRDILFNNSLGAFDIKISTNDVKTPEQGKKADPKKQEKKPEYKPKQEKQEKKETEVNPAEVVKSVEEQKPEIQTTKKTQEEKAAEAERAANFAEAMKNQQETQVIEASSAIH